MTPARLEMIEEGDTTSLAGIARLCHALGIGLRLTPDFQMEFAPELATVTRLAVASA